MIYFPAYQNGRLCQNGQVMGSMFSDWADNTFGINSQQFNIDPNVADSPLWGTVKDSLNSFIPGSGSLLGAISSGITKVSQTITKLSPAGSGASTPAVPLPPPTPAAAPQGKALGPVLLAAGGLWALLK